MKTKKTKKIIQHAKREHHISDSDAFLPDMCSFFLWVGVELDSFAATSAGCTRDDGSRSSPIRSSTLRGRCSSVRANFVTCAVKTHRIMFVFSWCRYPSRDQSQLTRSRKCENEAAPSNPCWTSLAVRFVRVSVLQRERTLLRATSLGWPWRLPGSGAILHLCCCGQVTPLAGPRGSRTARSKILHSRHRKLSTRPDKHIVDQYCGVTVWKSFTRFLFSVRSSERAVDNQWGKKSLLGV